MGCRVVTISRTLAAGGEEVGRAVARELGFRYVDDEIVVAAAEKAGVSAEVVEQAERTPPLIQRILEAMGTSAPLEPMVWPAGVAPPAQTSHVYQALIQSVIQETAQAGDVVIVAHGASIPLAGTSGLLRVLVTAPPAERAQRLALDSKLSQSEAKKAIDDSDRQRREYLRRFYNVREELPTHYDLVINTDHLTLEAAAELVLTATRRI